MNGIFNVNNHSEDTARGTADCKSLATNKLKWKTTIDLLCLNREVGPAQAGKIIRFIRGKSIVVFHCSPGFVARLLQSAVAIVNHNYQTMLYSSPDWPCCY